MIHHFSRENTTLAPIMKIKMIDHFSRERRNSRRRRNSNDHNPIKIMENVETNRRINRLISTTVERLWTSTHHSGEQKSHRPRYKVFVESSELYKSKA